MSIASIMVSLDPGRSSSARVRLAASLAERFEATLSGVAARDVEVPGPVGDTVAAQAAYEDAMAELATELEQARALFERNAHAAPRTGWHQAAAAPETFLVRQVRGADLVVVGRDPREDGAGGMGAAPDTVLMQVGRPVLVVPLGCDRLKAARIVVAWKDGPQARRAVTAALPFLASADQVFVVSAGSEARFEGPEEVSELLARHGAHVTTHLLDARAPDVAREILRFAGRQDADLIAMGGYGHSRLREWLLGGVTRDMLRTSPLCCLMCH